MSAISGNRCILDTLLIKPKLSQMSKGMAAQVERVRVDEKRIADLKYVADDSKDMYRACWNEELELASQTKRHQNELKEIQVELQLGNQTLKELRRAQLKRLLETEDAQYRDELNAMGLTIFKERL